MRQLFTRVFQALLLCVLVSTSGVFIGPACSSNSGVDPPLDSTMGDADTSVTSVDAEISEPADEGILDAGADSGPADTSLQDLAPDAEADAISCHSYESTVQEIFNQACVNCHESGSDNNGLNLMPGQSYDSLMNSVSTHDPTLTFVVPGDADASFLFEKMNPNPSHGLVMPVTGVVSGTPLPIETRQLVADWINAGANLAPFGCE